MRGPSSKSKYDICKSIGVLAVRQNGRAALLLLCLSVLPNTPLFSPLVN